MTEGKKMGRGVSEVETELESRIEALGFELVSTEWAGSRNRPVLRVRVDHPGSGVGEGVTVDDCAKVSRGLEPWLDALEAMGERYVLEVSSPGVERPLVRLQDWERFKGEEVVVKGHDVLADRSTRLEAELLGLVEGDEPAARLRLQDGEEVTVRLSGVKSANLLFRWK
jgi:ribosome maturation factor RimP